MGDLRGIRRTVHPHVLFAAALAVFFAGCALFARMPDVAPPEEELWPGTEAWAQARLAEMTLEEKVSQLFSIRAFGRFTSTDDPEYRRLVRLVEDFGAGGVTFFRGYPLDQAILTNDLQRRARIPLLIAQDMEWGAAMRLQYTTNLPRAMAIGATRDPELAYQAGLVTAREARALGVHYVFAPVADVNSDPENPIINVRSFGEQPVLVAEMAEAFMRGLQAGRTIATAKHFPGHGDTSVDSHVTLPVLPFGMDRLRSVELVPFRRLVDAGVMSVMTAHLALPRIEPEPNLPATLSHRITTGILREELGFEGLIVTDALDMGGVTEHFSTGEIAVGAVQAGADVLLLSEDPVAARRAILQAVERGEITEARIDASVLRLLRAKAWVGLGAERLVDVNRLRQVVASEPHLATSETIARRSVTMLRNEGDLVPLRNDGRVLVLTLSDGTDPAAGAGFVSALRRSLDRATIASFLIDDRSHPDEHAMILDEATPQDVIVVPLYAVVRSGTGRLGLADKNIEFLGDLLSRDVPIVLVSFGDPYVAAHVSQPAAYVAAYGSSEVSERAVADALAGRAGFHGRLPISIPGLYDVGDGIEMPQRIVRIGLPSEVGMSIEALARVDSLVPASIQQGAFPGAAVAIGRNGVVTKLEAYGYHTYDHTTRVTTRSRFDMASLTKVVATTTAAMLLYEEGRLGLDDRVVDHLPEFGGNGKDVITIRQLLTHTAGLVPGRAYHQIEGVTRQVVLDSIMAETLVYPPGTESRYSDLSMIALMLVIEEITGDDFATFTRERIFEPLGMHDTGYVSTFTPDTNAVPTEVDARFRGRLIRGEVHDETAWILGGVAGHAGLFSTAEDLARFAYMLLNGGYVNGMQFLQESTILAFTRAQDPERHTRALGWIARGHDPEAVTSAGRFFGANSFGHTGFTGTSIWIDPDADLFVILLTNRVYPTRDNTQVFQVRSRLADVAHEALLGPPAFVDTIIW